MSNSCVTNQYFSGQGSVLLAQKDPTTGAPLGFIPVGNCSALTLGVETTVYQHKESCTGTRGIDKEIVQEISVSVSLILQSMNKENLALALYGSESTIASGSASDEEHTLYHDKWIPLDHIKVSNLIVGDDANPTTTYVLDTDYEVNTETGSVKALSTGTITDLQNVFFDYDYEGYDKIEGIETSSAPERWIRFEGLNTADGDNPVVIDLYRVSVQPLAELALINEELAEAEINATALTDTTRSSGSTYFTVRQITTN